MKVLLEKTNVGLCFSHHSSLGILGCTVQKLSNTEAAPASTAGLTLWDSPHPLGPS